MSGCQVNTFDASVKAALQRWGDHFALHRDCEYLGHQGQNMLQVLFEHGGEMPPRPTGWKPIEVDPLAWAVELHVHAIALDSRLLANILRAYYCGRGRVKKERRQTAEELNRIANVPPPHISERQFLTLHDLAFQRLAGAMAADSRKAA